MQYQRFIYFLFILLLIIPSCRELDETSAPIIEKYIDSEIYVEYGFAGEILTIKKLSGSYYIKRDICGSGVPIAATYTIKGDVTTANDKQIIKGRFYDLDKEIIIKIEFTLQKASVYYNDIQIQISRIIQK